MSKDDARAARKLPKNEERKALFMVPTAAPTHQFDGWVEVAIYASGIYIRWEGEEEWGRADWWEVARLTDIEPPKLRDELQWERERGYNEGLQQSTDELRDRAVKEAYARGFEDARLGRFKGQGIAVWSPKQGLQVIPVVGMEAKR